ncbi:hypothetical protein ACFZCY_20220 [Streptomyces sp. NPDC007983]|uniref:hypothetical protein n=1 Tax=Streptomyces sp. NPDC007983 TaxID=3364800 RepID=UPI0036E0EB2C
MSASPRTVIEGNYIYDNRNTVGLYVQVSGGNWPTAARQVMDQAGIETGLRSSIGR